MSIVDNLCLKYLVILFLSTLNDIHVGCFSILQQRRQHARRQVSPSSAGKSDATMRTKVHSYIENSWRIFTAPWLYISAEYSSMKSFSGSGDVSICAKILERDDKQITTKLIFRNQS